jgi:hypothetical protein
MRNLRVILPLSVGALIGVYLVFVIVWPTVRVFRSFDNLERNAKRVITGPRLQEWATNLLAVAPTNTYLKVSQLGTNFPSQLLGLYRNPPYISIHEATALSPPCVYLMWGGGVIGHCGFEIGATNFVSHRPNARAWQPGVYFWSDYPHQNTQMIADPFATEPAWKTH